MPRRPGAALQRLRILCAVTLLWPVALPDPAFASSPAPVPNGQSMEGMSDAELDRFVQQLNQSANWRKYRRPGDPPDFVPGAPVKVMFGAGASFGRGGARAGGGAFRKNGAGARRSGLSSRRRGRDESANGVGSRSSRGNSSSSSSGSSFGGGSRSSNSGNSNFGNNMNMNQGGFGEN